MSLNQKKWRFRWQERWEDLGGVKGEGNYNQNIWYEKQKKKKHFRYNNKNKTKIKVLTPSDVKTCSINLKEINKM